MACLEFLFFNNIILLLCFKYVTKSIKLYSVGLFIIFALDSLRLYIN